MVGELHQDRIYLLCGEVVAHYWNGYRLSGQRARFLIFHRERPDSTKTCQKTINKQWIISNHVREALSVFLDVYHDLEPKVLEEEK